MSVIDKTANIGGGLTVDEKRRETNRAEWERRYSQFMPHQKLFEPQHSAENVSQYQSRIYTLGKRYQRLPGHEQQVIQEAKKAGFHWRGEPHALFVQFFEEWERQQYMKPSERKNYRNKKYGFVQELKNQEIDNESVKQQQQLYGETG